MAIGVGDGVGIDVGIGVGLDVGPDASGQSLHPPNPATLISLRHSMRTAMSEKELPATIFCGPVIPEKTEDPEF
jgi:hypothetical protein